MAIGPGISLAQLTYFVAAAEHGSMTAAADALFVAQSAVSTSVSQLESRLGVTLFVRKPAKGLDVTADGQVLLVRARDILAQLRDAVDAVSPHAVSGTLEVACAKPLSPTLVPQVWDALHGGHRSLQVNVRELDTAQVLSGLKERAIEAALTYDLHSESNVAFEVLQEHPAFLALPKRHRLAHRPAVSLREVVGEPFILLDVPGVREYHLQAFASNGASPQLRYRFENPETVHAMVAGGHGFTLANQLAVRSPADSGVALVPILESIPPLRVVFAHRADAPLSKKAQTFRSVCRAALARREIVPFVGARTA